MSKIKQLASQVSLYGGSYIFIRILNLLLVYIYLTHKFGEASYFVGAYKELYWYIGLSLVFLGLRMETAYFRFADKPYHPDKLFSQISTLLILVSTGYFALTSLFRYPLARALNHEGQEHYFILVGAIVFLDILIAVPFARLRLENQAKKFVQYKMYPILVFIALIFFIVEGLPRFFGIELSQPEILTAIFIANVVSSGLSLLLISPYYRRLKWSWNGPLIRELLKYTWPLILVGIAGLINQGGYIVLQKYGLVGDVRANLSAGGIYSAAVTIAVMMNLFNTAYNYAAEPFFFSQDKTNQDLTIYADATRAYAIVASLFLLGIVLYIDVIELIYPKNYRAALPYTMFLLLAFLFLGLYYNVSIWYKLKDKTIYGALIAGIGAILTVAIQVIGLPKWGYAASVLAAVCCYFTMLALGVLWGKRFFPVPYQWARIAFPIVLALGLGLAKQHLVSFPHLWQNLVASTFILLLFLGICYVSEKSFVQRVLKNT